MLKAKRNHPVRGDWFSKFEEILKCFNIDICIEDIQMMTRDNFRKMTTKKVKKQHLNSSY